MSQRNQLRRNLLQLKMHKEKQTDRKKGGQTFTYYLFIDVVIFILHIIKFRYWSQSHGMPIIKHILK